MQVEKLEICNSATSRRDVPRKLIRKMKKGSAVFFRAAPGRSVLFLISKTY